MRWILAFVLIGCAGLGTDPDDAETRDAGMGTEDAGTDAGATDAGTALDSGADAAPPVEPAFDGLQADPDLDSSLATEDPGLHAAPGRVGTMTCYDESDNDGDISLDDCATESCRSLATCCIGNADCCEAAVTPLDIACADDFGACTAGTSAFGAPLPFLDGTSLAMGGDAEFDSGLIGAETIDLASHRTSLRVTFEQATCTGPCLESAAVGFTTQDTMGDQNHVEPIVGMMASRGMLNVLVAGTVVQQLSFTEEREEWLLTMRPTGIATIEGRSGTATVSFQPTDARFVAWGHSRNPSATLDPGEARARIADLTLSTRLCENPSAWNEGEAVTVFDGGDTVSFPQVRRVSVARGNQTWVLIELDDGKLLLAEEVARGLDLLVPLTGAPVVPPGWATGLGDMTIAVDPAAPDILLLFFVAETASGRALGRAQWNGSTWNVDDAAVGRVADTFGAPTAIVHREHLVVVGEEEGTLGVYLQPQSLREIPDSLVRVETSQLPALGMGARDPSLVVHGSAYELHYARRIGTRWHVGLMASDELVAWRLVEDRAFRGSQGFDRLGASAPAALSDPDAVSLYYVGHDGVRAMLGTTRRTAADGSPTDRQP